MYYDQIPIIEKKTDLLQSAEQQLEETLKGKVKTIDGRIYTVTSIEQDKTQPKQEGLYNVTVETSPNLDIKFEVCPIYSGIPCVLVISVEDFDNGVRDEVEVINVHEDKPVQNILDEIYRHIEVMIELIDRRRFES